MATDYQIPAWLRPSDPVSAFMDGQRLGAQVGMEQDRLQKEREQAGMRYAMEQKQLERSILHQEQQMAVQQAYHEQQIDLRQQRLDQVAAAAKEKSAAAAKAYADTQGFLKAVAGGASVPTALAQFPQAAPKAVGATKGGQMHPIHEVGAGIYTWDEKAGKYALSTPFPAKPAKFGAKRVTYDETGAVKSLSGDPSDPEFQAVLKDKAEKEAEKATAEAGKPGVLSRVWGAIFNNGGTPEHPVGADTATSPVMPDKPAESAPGQAAVPKMGVDDALAFAKGALAKGAPREKVAARFKELTGQEMPEDSDQESEAGGGG